MLRKHGFAVLSILVLAAASSGPMWGQGNTGRLEGRVVDPSGAAVPNANVVLTSVATGKENTVATDATTGNFAIPALEIGHYTISVEVTGFKKYTQDVRIDPGQVANAVITLETGQVTETVNVTEEAGLVQSASSDISATMNAEMVTDLPLNGRDFTQVALLSPGVTRGNPNGSATGAGGNAETFRYGGVGGAALAVNGLPPQANNFMLDGIDNNESLVNTIVFFPPAEAIQEFAVSTSVAPAEFGRAGGAIVNTGIKSGTNDVHGSAFEFLRNSELDARQTYAATKTLFQRNQFGGTLGLPIIHNKFFIFGDYQGLRQDQPLEPGFVTVPTAQMRNGDFSQLLNPALSPTGAPIHIINLMTGLPYTNNIIPPGDINKIGQAYLNAFPLPTFTNLIEHNYVTGERQIQTFDDFDIRGDYIVSDRQSMFARYSFGQDISTTTSEFPNLPAGFGTGSNFNKPRGAVWSDTYAFSATLVNQLWLGWQTDYLGYQPPFFSTPVSANLGIPNANRSPLLGGGALIGGYASELEYTGDYGLYGVPENTYQIKDGLTKSTGKHTFKFGADIVQRQVNYFRPIAGKGFFNLIGNGTPANCGGAASTGYEVSDILAGFVCDYQIGVQSGYYGTRSWEDGIFVQDDWKVSNRLTLNLGLRYEILTWPTENFNRQSNFDLANGTVLLAGQNGNSDSLVNNDWHNFAPRAGFAYQLTDDGKTVIRGGGGIFYFLERGGISNQLGQNPPFAGNSTYNYTSAYRITLAGAAPAGSNDWLLSNPAALPAPGFVGFNPAAPANVSLFADLMNNVTPRVYEYNLQIQREVFKDAVFSLAYVGDIGKHLPFYYNANQQFFNAPSGAKLYPALGTVTVQADRGNSSYNALQAQFEKRMSNGLQFRGSFTWSKDIDDGSTDGLDMPQPQNSFNFAAERGLSALDQQYVWVFDILYELPFGRGRAFGNNWARPIDEILGGWHLNAIWSWESGLPLNITLAGSNIRPDLVGPLTVIGNPGMWFNTAGCPSSPSCPFVAPPVNASGVYVSPGDLGRDVIFGPGFNNVDLAVFKDFSITERVKLQFRGEFYNILNHPHYNPPDVGLGDSNFGVINSTLLDTERQIELAARIYF